MKERLSVIAISSLLLSSMLTTGCGSTSGAVDVTPQKQTALFHSFSYSGNDDIYAQNELAEPGAYHNPILPGWYSDPTICTNGEGDYFLATSTFTYYPGVPLFHSKDMVNWKQVGHILTRPEQFQNMERQLVSGGIFAPALAYNPHNKTYYMITTNVGAGNFFVKTQDPFGEWSDPIMLPEVQGIDPSFFFDEDGKGYIVNNDDAPDYKPEYPGHRTVRVVEFDPKTDKCVGERKIVVNKGCRPEERPIWCEGPHIYKVNGKYYLMTAEGGTSGWHSEVIYRGDTPFGPYQPYEGNPILTQRTLDPKRPNPVTCAGHADIIQAKEGDWWGVFLACRPIDGEFENLGRETFLLPVKWTEDGWPYFLGQNETVPLSASREGVTRNDSVTFGNFSKTDDFDSEKLGLEWLTLRGPATEYWSLKSTPGFLSLKCAPVNSTETAVIPYVGRRVQHHVYDASTRMTFSPESDQECAGLLLMKDETHQYLLCLGCNDRGHCIMLNRIGEGKTETLATAPVDDDLTTVDLKVNSKGKTLAFSYSPDGGKNWKTVAENVDAGYLSTDRTGGFTGTTVGMYATGNNNPQLPKYAKK